MSSDSTYLQMFSTLTAEGELRLELKEQPMPIPGENEVLIRIEATPINPSDHGVMFGWASMASATSSGNGADTVLSAPVSEQGMAVMKARIGQSLAVGNEGAGTVVATGTSELAKSLDGKVVAAMGGGMYGQYRCVDASVCLPLLEGHTAKDGASSFVNPLTALCMIETMNLEGHTALVHTAAASISSTLCVKTSKKPCFVRWAQNTLLTAAKTPLWPTSPTLFTQQARHSPLTQLAAAH